MLRHGDRDVRRYLEPDSVDYSLAYEIDPPSTSPVLDKLA
jgi:hypothetical protein